MQEPSTRMANMTRQMATSGGDIHALIEQLRNAERCGDRVRIIVGERSFPVQAAATTVVADALREFAETSEPEAVSVAEASLIMGVSREETLHRIRSERIRGVQRAGRLMVLRDSLPAPTVPSKRKGRRDSWGLGDN